MIIPLEISSRNVELSDEMEDLIREKAEKLENFYQGIISCRVMVDIPHRSQNKGNRYNVRIDMTLPGGELVIKREPHEDLHAAIVNSFDTAQRQLKAYASEQRGDVKRHEEKPVATVSKLFPEEGYGFLVGLDGREIYFHENSVLNGDFSDLKVGMKVSYVEHLGEKGAQASSVTPA